MIKCSIKVMGYAAVLSSSMVMASQVYDDQAWTWLYKKSFNSAEYDQTREHAAVTLDKTDIPPFTQLVMSWNAWRPTTGYFSFWVQSRDQATHAWSNWHKMMVWGAQVQQSYLSK